MTLIRTGQPVVEIQTEAVALRVLVIDDERAVREGLRRLITGGLSHPTSVRVAATPAEALHEAQTMKPHLAVLDLDLAGEDGLALIPSLARSCRVLVLTSHGDATICAQALALGAGAFVEKHEPASRLLAQLDALALAAGLATPSH
jgi:DNA-binding NarL/FixJ family response regulator